MIFFSNLLCFISFLKIRLYQLDGYLVLVCIVLDQHFRWFEKLNQTRTVRALV